MSTRITRKDLEQSVKVLANRLGVPAEKVVDKALWLDHSSDGWRLIQFDGPGERDISSRLSASDLKIWLDGAITALDIRPRE